MTNESEFTPEVQELQNVFAKEYEDILSGTTTKEEYIRQRREQQNKLDEFERLSQIDPLTGLLNRRGAEAALKRTLDSLKRLGIENPEIAAVIIDLDHFKLTNDIYGHGGGDEALRGIGEILPQVAKRATDIVCRWGGEEFLVITISNPEQNSGSVIDGAVTVSSRIKNALSKRREKEGSIFNKMTQDGNPQTASMGIAKGTVLEEVVRFADVALYFAKENGRDRICVYTDKNPGSPIKTVGNGN